MPTTYNTFYRSRLWIGPELLPPDHANHYNWPALNAGSTYNFGAISATLSAQLDSGVTEAQISDAATFPDAGGAWIGPGADPAQDWEYTPYDGVDVLTNRLLNLIRETADNRAHNGIHAAGATVTPWYLLDTATAPIQYTESANDDLAVVDWKCTIGGVRVPVRTMRPQHIVILETQSAQDQPWSLFLLGFVRSAQIRDDYQRAGEWTIQIESIGGILSAVDVPGIRVGAFEIARHGTAASSTTLAQPYKERDTGDYTEADPDLSAQNVIDPETDLPWIADKMIGTLIDTGEYDTFSELYINPPAEINKGYRYIEITNTSTGSSTLEVWDPITASQRQLLWPSMSAGPNGSILIVENEAKFLEANPSASPDRIYSVEDSNDPNMFEYLRPEGGALAFKNPFGGYTKGILWGIQTGGPPDWGTPEGMEWDSAGGSIPAPGVGETIMATANTPPVTQGDKNHAGNFVVGKAQSPGYQIKSDRDNAWIMITLPGMDLRLTANITAASPTDGEILYIENESGPSTDGLDPAGTIQIGGERIAYQSTTAAGVILAATGARGAGGTTPADHVAGDPVLIVDPANGQATDAYSIRETSIARSGGTIYPADFNMRWSNLAARNPDEHLHENDYPHVFVVTGNAAPTWAIGHVPPIRVKTILIEFLKMTTDPARPRLNEIRALVDEATIAQEHMITGSATVADIAEKILLSAQVPAGAIVKQPATATISDLETAEGNAWQIVSDLMDQTGCRIRVGRDSKIDIAPFGFYINTHFTSHLWQDSNAVSIERVIERNYRASQIKIEWRSPDNSADGIATFPAIPEWTGDVIEIGPLIYADQATADLAARRRFYMLRYPYTTVIQSADPRLLDRPLMYHAVAWKLDPDRPASAQNHMIRSVDHMLENGIWTTVESLIAIDRETATI